MYVEERDLGQMSVLEHEEEQEEMVTCEKCGCSIHQDDAYWHDNTCMCEDCFDDSTVECSRCGHRIWNSDDYGDETISLCQRCHDNYYTHCESCNNLIHIDDAYYSESSDSYYCCDCHEDHYDEDEDENNYIKSYSYKPTPIFYGGAWDSKTLFLGVELELDIAGEDSHNAKEILNIANDYVEHIYIKHDGSLSHGFELVSHPASLAYHQDTLPWGKIFDAALNMGYRSHDTSTAGLHCHVSRSALGSTYEDQEDTIARILFFIEKFWPQMLVFSRRTEENINRWARRYGLMDDVKTTLQNAKDNNAGRYVCLNLQNRSTIEFRIFRGTLKYNSFIAALQLVHQLCIAAISMSDQDFHNMTWDSFVLGIDQIDKPELIKYLKQKRLYALEGATA